MSTNAEGHGTEPALQATSAQPTTTSGSPTHHASPTQDPLWVERTGERTYTGFSARGAQVLMGPVEAGAVFTPGELLKIALAGCAGMSADRAMTRRLGDDVRVTIHVDGPKHPTEDRYTLIRERFELDLSALDDASRAELLTVMLRAIDKTCTVGHTLEQGAEVQVTMTDTAPEAAVE